ncbi:bacterioferritin [Geodermatophilus sp. CPCC 206100]|uniref:bacterioferritin n=1 Tax=Geodermatophilus sp. CPCC 206100 TaxID=3020054 RepID=UPI003B006DD2
MQGDARVIEYLNEQLTSELTAINQYFLHAKMQENWGYNRLAAYTRKESIEEMTHAERLTDRILFLEGLPNYQRLLPLRIGQTVREQFESDMAVEVEVLTRLREAIPYCESVGDRVSKNLFEEILTDEEHHIDYLETQLHLLDTLGEQLYLASQVEQQATGTE